MKDIAKNTGRRLPAFSLLHDFHNSGTLPNETIAEPPAIATTNDDTAQQMKTPESGKLEEYMEKLITSFNPSAAEGVMCRDTISIGWDGTLYDCDFNQMLEIETNHGAPNHIRDWNEEMLNEREIMVNQHCFGCTAGAGSSCGGATTKQG